MVAASYKGRSIPQWLIDAVYQRLAPEEQTRLADVEKLVRREFPRGGCAEVHDLAAKVAAAFRKVRQMDAIDRPVEAASTAAHLVTRPRG